MPLLVLFIVTFWLTLIFFAVFFPRAKLGTVVLTFGAVWALIGTVIYVF